MNQQGRLQISGSLLARNTLLNFVGQAVPLLVGLVTTPFIVRGLGTERFGLLSLAWVVVGYFAVFDLGLGRATIKFVAEALGKGETEEIPRLVWTTVTVQGILGVVGGLVLVGITPLLVGRVLNIPAELLGEAKTTFYLLALSVPVVLVFGSLRGALEAVQRFDLINAVRILSSASTFLLPLIGLILGFQLPGIVALILLSRLGALVAFAMLNIRLTPELKRYSGSFALFPRLFSFGGWVTVSSIISPILGSLDRFLIGSLLSMAAVAYYSAPQEAVGRLRIIPASLTATLFPAFSALEGAKDRERLGTFFARSIKYILLGLGPVIIGIILFAKDILQIWLGTEFARESVAVLRILGLGIMINSLAHPPIALLQGVGRPDLPVKFYLLELPIYIGTAWFLIGQWGIAGAAGAWAFRVTLDTFLLFGATFRVCRLSPRLLTTNGVTLISTALLFLGGTAYGLKSMTSTFPLLSQAFLFVTFFGIFTWFIWRNLLDASEQGAILRVVGLRKESSSHCEAKREHLCTKGLIVSSSKPPSVAVIVATFNRPSHLRVSLNALAEQNYEGEWCVIVVDDCSTTQYNDVISEGTKVLEKRGVKVHYIRLSSNLGQAAARNEGVRFAKAAIVAFLDDDERPEPNWIRELVRGFSYGSDIAGVGGRVVNVESPGYAQWRVRGYDQGQYIHEATFLQEGNAAFRRDAFLEVGGFDPKLRFAHEGIDLYLRLRNRGYRLLYNPSAVVYHNHAATIRGILRKAWFLGTNAAYVHAKHKLGSTLIRKASRSTLLLDLLVWFNLGTTIFGLTLCALDKAGWAVLLGASLLGWVLFLAAVFLLFRPRNIKSVALLVMSLLVEKGGNIVGEIHRVIRL